MKQLEENCESLQGNSFHLINQDFLNLTPAEELDFGAGEVDQESLRKINGLKRELIFVLGIYSTKELIIVHKQLNPGSHMIVIEPNPDYFIQAIHFKNLDFLKHKNITLFADQLQSLPLFLDRMLSTELIYYLQNIRFYFTEFYRSTDVSTAIEVVRKIREAISHKSIVYGNSVEDSLIGLNQNLENVRHMARSKQVNLLKSTLQNRPAIVVAAGPSLNKNIKDLKRAKGKFVIIAVDTIASKLISEDIVPDFICSIERGVETYDYFYANKQYPKEVTLVAPLLMHPAIFNEFVGELIIPFRQRVGEYLWLQEVLELDGDHSISMGTSCAHVAFGLAAHLNASPIILVGQDLAFAEDKNASTHAEGTIYDQVEQREVAFSQVERILTEGYMGEAVETTAIWNSFRQWIEVEINRNDLYVINATEGGAKIYYTQQMSLQDAIDRYEEETPMSIRGILDKIPNYPIKQERLIERFREERQSFQIYADQFIEQRDKIKSLLLKKNASIPQMQNFIKQLESTNKFYQMVKSHGLLRHNLQPVVITTMWQLFDIEQVLSYPTLIQNQKVQVQFLEICVFVLNKIIEAIDFNVLEPK